tara:strand:+ start:591 stop:983 length:393 start_codon:yes stop_codon:yes gene_type:complete
MNKIIKVFDNERGQPWTIRIVDKGDNYGREDCLTNDKNEPLVEFYDADHPHSIDVESGTILGQFVSRYNFSTIADSTGGIDLMGYEPKWKMDYLALNSVRAHLKAYAATEKYEWFEESPYNVIFTRNNDE